MAVRAVADEVERIAGHAVKSPDHTDRAPITLRRELGLCNLLWGNKMAVFATSANVVGYPLTGRPSMATQCRQIEAPVKADTLATPKSNEPTPPFTGQRNLKPHRARLANTLILCRRCVVCPSQVRVRGLFTTQEDDVRSRVAYKVGIAANDMRRLHVMLRVLQPKSQIAFERAHAAAVVGHRDLGGDVPKPDSPIPERNRHVRRVAVRDDTSRRHNSSIYDGCGNQRNKDSQCGAKAAELDVHVIET